jgi:putative transcriptional regulator
MRKQDFDQLVTSIKQAGRIRRGQARPARVTVFKPADVRAVRARLGLSQAEFALLIGVSLATLRNWEQGRRVPEGPARALLRVAAANPRAVAAALGA